MMRMYYAEYGGDDEDVLRVKYPTTHFFSRYR